MTETTKKPNWIIPGVLSVALIALMMIETAVIYKADGTGTTRGDLWILANIILSLATCWTWYGAMKTLESFNAPSRAPFKPTMPFFMTWIVTLVPLIATAALFGEIRAIVFHIEKINIFFGIVWGIFFLRGVLILIVKKASGKGDALNPRMASAWADGVLILALGLRYALASHRVKPLILGIVFGALRVGWGYVPDERLEIVQEFFVFLSERKLWWMTPIFIIMGLLIVLVLISEGTGGSIPFIYAVF